MIDLLVQYKPSMSAGPKRPPRPSLPRSTHRDDGEVCTSTSGVDGTDLAISNDNKNDHESTSSENINTQRQVAGNCASANALDTELVAAEIGIAQSKDCVTLRDTSSTESQTDKKCTKPVKKEAGDSSPAKGVTPVKPRVAARTSSAEVKFRGSPKAHKAPPVPSAPTLLSKESRPLSADGEKALPVTDHEKCESESVSCQNVSRDSSPCGKCTTVSSSASIGHPDSKPALKPKPVTSVVRESIGSEDGSGSLHLANTSSLTSDPLTSNSEATPTASNAASPPIYAVVNKSRTPRTTSNIDGDESNSSKSGSGIAVGRSMSAGAAGATPPKKPPRTFAHSDYMRLKSLSLPRSSEPPSGSDCEQIGGTEKKDSTRATENINPEINVDGDGKVNIRISESAATKPKECGFDGNGTEQETRAKDDSGKVKRRQSDKLPAPPRPPPPSFSDSRSSTLSSRSSVVDVDEAVGGHSEKGDNKDMESQKPEYSALSLEDRQEACNRLKSVSHVPDDDNIYAVPSEVNCGNTRCSSEVSPGATARRNRLTCTHSAASEVTRPVCLV